MTAPTLATHWMIVANSTLNEAVSHDSYHPIWKKFVANLLNFRQALSCTVCKGILEEAYSPIPSNFEQDCQHHACKACLGKKKTLKPPCVWCRDYDKYVRCTVIDNHVRSYENLCEYLRQSRQYVVIKNEVIVDSTSSISLPEALQDSRGLCVEKLVNEIMMLSGSGGGGFVIRDKALTHIKDETCELSDENSDSRSEEFEDMEHKLRLFSRSDFGSPSGGSCSDGKPDEFGFNDFQYSYSCSITDDDDGFLTIDRMDALFHDDLLDSGCDPSTNNAFDMSDVGSAPSHVFRIKDAPMSSACASSSAPTSLFDTLVDRKTSVVVKSELEDESNEVKPDCSAATSTTTTTVRGFDFGGNVATNKLAAVKTEGKAGGGKSTIPKSLSAANLMRCTPVSNVSQGASSSTSELVSKSTTSSTTATTVSRNQVLGRPAHTMLLAFKTPAPVEAKSSSSSSSSSSSQNGTTSSTALSTASGGSSRRPHASKTSKNRKGCRCGTATNNPGTLTCCGQRCPCYVEAKECIDCKCRGCRNPYRSGGRKVRPHIVPTENIQVHFPPSPKPYIKPGSTIASSSIPTATSSIAVGSINVGQIVASPGQSSSTTATTTASNSRPTLQYLIEQGHNANISVNVSVSAAPKNGITAKLNTDPAVGVSPAQISIANDELIKLLH